MLDRLSPVHRATSVPCQGFQYELSSLVNVPCLGYNFIVNCRQQQKTPEKQSDEKSKLAREK